MEYVDNLSDPLYYILHLKIIQLLEKKIIEPIDKMIQNHLLKVLPDFYSMFM